MEVEFMKMILIIISLWVATSKGQSGDDELLNVDLLDSKYKECFIDGNVQCNFNEKEFLVAQTWVTKECRKCQCYKDLGILCCDLLKFPIDWPEHCYPVVDKKECKVELTCPTKRRHHIRSARRRNLMTSGRGERFGKSGE
ncbi:prostate-associated microseminoprotein-like [Clavelina lepadiformis]|uniref:prostate-associated microseminoprotein-like n=1 Tax=Clavelina lepadiformis TaxID=159417 RepID=UPI004041E4BD